MPEFIGRKRQIGIGKESVAGTSVAATDWIPVDKPGFKPVSEKAVDTAAYGNIDELKDEETTKNMTEIGLEGILRDDWLGLLLLGGFGSETVALDVNLASVVGTFVAGETVTGGTSLATGTIKRLEGTAKMYIEVVSGTFTTGETITGGTSGATAAMTYDVLVRAHIFERLNTNNHPTFTIWKVDDIDTQKAAYAMINTLNIEATVGDYSRFVADFKAKKIASGSESSSYSSSNPFLAKHASLKFAATTSALDGATATPVSRAKFTIAKNLTDYQAFGDDDIASIHNQQFGIVGDLDAILSDVVLRDYMLDSTKKAVRITMENTDVTIGTTANPRLQLELARVSFSDWSASDDNNALVTQTIGFKGTFSTDDAYTGIAILVNDQITAY